MEDACTILGGERCRISAAANSRKGFSEHQGDGWILDGVLVKRVLKIGGWWKGLTLAVLNLRFVLFECVGCVAVGVEQR